MAFACIAGLQDSISCHCRHALRMQREPFILLVPSLLCRTLIQFCVVFFFISFSLNINQHFGGFTSKRRMPWIWQPVQFSRYILPTLNNWCLLLLFWRRTVTAQEMDNLFWPVVMDSMEKAVKPLWVTLNAVIDETLFKTHTGACPIQSRFNCMFKLMF